jgi:RhoGEF domain
MVRKKKTKKTKTKMSDDNILESLDLLRGAYLKKKGAKRKNWKRRYFEYSPSDGHWHYASSSSLIAKPLGSVAMLSGTSVARAECFDSEELLSSQKDKSRMLVVVNAHRTLVAMAESSEQRDEFVRQLCELLRRLYSADSDSEFCKSKDRLEHPLKKAQTRSRLGTNLFEAPPSRSDDDRLDAAEQKRREQRRLVRQELLSTEQSYVDVMRALVDDYLKPLRARAADIGVSSEDLAVVFANAELLLRHNSALLERLRDADTSSSAVGPIFVDMEPMFRAYSIYVGDLPASKRRLGELLERSAKFRDALAELRAASTHANLELANLQSWPVQRVPRYLLLLRELMKNTEVRHPHWLSLREALVIIERVAARINSSLSQEEHMAIIGDIERSMRDADFLHLAQPNRRFIKRGRLQKLWGTQGLDRTREPGDAEWATFFLFNDLLCWAVGDELAYEGLWQLEHAKILEPNDSDDSDDGCAFTFAYRRFRSATEDASVEDTIERRYALRAKSPEEAASWIDTLRDTIDYLDSMPADILDGLKRTWQNDSLSDASVQGFLNVKKLAWRRYYCKLAGRTLFIFEKTTDSVPKLSVVDLHRYAARRAEDPKRPYAIALQRINNSKKKKPFIVEADQLFFGTWLSHFQSLSSNQASSSNSK